MKSLAMQMVIFSVLVAGADNDWKKSVDSGRIDAGDNWGSGVYGMDGTLNRWSLGNTTVSDYVVTFPGDGFEENGCTYTHVMDEGDSVTFDCRGSWWYKGAANYSENYFPFMMTRGTASKQVLCVSGSYKNSANPVFLLTDGLMKYTYFENGSRFDLLQGTWNLYNPRGVASKGGLILDEVNANSTTELHAGSRLVVDGMEQRGGTFVVSGGNHTINGVFHLGSRASRTVGFAQSGGSVTNADTFYVGYQSGVTATAAFSGNACFRKTAGKMLLAQGASSVATVTVADDASVEVEETTVGVSGQGRIELDGNGKMKVSTVLRMGSGAASVGEISVGGQATFTVDGRAAETLVGNADGSSASIVVEDDGLLEFTTTKQLRVGYNAGTTGSILARGRGRIEGQSGMNTVLGGGAAASLTVEDSASAIFPGSTFVVRGTGTRVDLRGGEASFYNLQVSGSDASNPSVVCVSGGSHSILNSSTSDNAFYFSSSAARCELLGGTFTCRVLKGDGASTLYADGGRLVADQELKNFASATLGARGLLLAPPQGKSLTCRQAFTDAPTVAGRIVVAGDGEVVAAVDSAHAETEVAQGTLRLGAGVTTFGRALVVTNGACVSVAGDATELTVTDLVLGDTVSAGRLVLDAGDVVTVSGAFSAPNAEIDCAVASVAGSYDLFRCTRPIDAATFANVRFVNADAAFSRDFSVVESGGKYVARVTVTPRTVTDKTWTGTAGDIWSAPENWSPTGAADAWNNVTFPASVPTKSISFTTAAANAVTFSGGDYMLTGERFAINSGISSQVGTNRINALLDPQGGALTLMADAGAALVLGGGIASGTCGTVNLSGEGNILFAGENIVLPQTFAVAAGTPVVGAEDKATLEGGLTPLAGQPLTFAGTGELVVKKGAGSATYTASSTTIRSGKVTLKGAGRTSSRINHERSLTIGTDMPGAAPAVYEVADVLLYRGTQANVTLGNNIPADGPVAVGLSVHDADFYAKSLILGRYRTADGAIYTTSFGLTNAYMQLDGEFNLGAETSTPGFRNVVRAGSDAHLKVKSNINWIGHCDLLFASGAHAELLGALSVMNYANGVLAFADGARFSLARITAFSGNGVATFTPTLAFDGGVLEMTSSAVSCVRTPARRTVRVDAGGLTVHAGEGIRHVFTFPFRGVGDVAKTGAGVIVFGKGLAVNSDDGETCVDSGLLTADWEGTTRVGEGTLVLEADAARTNLAVVVAAGASLDLDGAAMELGTLSGAGTIAHAASLRCGIAFNPEAAAEEVPLFDEVARMSVKVDFGVAKGDRLERGRAFPVARLAAGSVFDASAWKGINGGEQTKVEFVCQNGVVSASAKSVGMIVVIR